MPLPGSDILLQCLVFGGIVFLHPHVPDGALVIEPEQGVLVHQCHVLRKGVLDVAVDGGVHLPVPLRVKVGVGDEKQCLLLRLGTCFKAWC